MKTFGGMSAKEREEFLSMLSKATQTVMPPDAFFVLIVSDNKGVGHMASNVEATSRNWRMMSEMLREVADQMEAKGVPHERN